MNRQISVGIMSPTRFLAVALMAGGVLFNSVSAVAEDPIPFNAMMQSASAQSAVPPRPDANHASTQQFQTGRVTNAGKAEIGAGIFLLAAGAASLAITGLVCSALSCKGVGGKEAAGYAGGAAAAVGGVTLIVIGSNRRSKRK